MGINTLYWIFSTIVQAFVALLALLGMVGIYKISTLETSFNRLADSIAKVLPSTKFLYEYTNREERLKEISKVISSYSKVPSVSTEQVVEKANLMYIELEHCQKTIRRFKIYFLSFCLVTISDIVLSLIFLMHAENIASLPYEIIYYYFALPIMAISLTSLFCAYLLIVEALRS